MSRRRNRRNRPKPNYQSMSTDKAINPRLARAMNSGNGSPFVRSKPFNENDVLQALTDPSVLAENPLPRDPYDDTEFGPLHPMPYAPIDPSRRDTGHPEPRIWEYEVGWNLPGQNNREIPFSTLRSAAKNVDLLRRCIEIRKSRITSLDWAWTVSDEAVELAMQGKSGAASKNDVEKELRDSLQGEIGRLTEFWRKPWKGNGLNFRQWLSMLLEEVFVVDALAIYPQMTYGGEVLNFEIIKGDTIKPLLDWRGATPQPPYPAYQQEIYGFPRSEFTATVSVDDDGNEVVDNAYLANQLYYYRSVPRAETPYGFSIVEQALISARLYLRRQGWMLSEYDDGVLPLVYFTPPADTAAALGERFTTTKRREWETAINDELSGDTRARHRGKVLPPGFEITTPPSVAEQYKPDYDMFLIRIMSAHMGVTIPSLNLQDSGGLGSTGYHEGLADIEFRNATLPTMQMVCDIINELSRAYLSAPMQLEFKLLGLEAEDEAAMDELAQARVASGRMTMNEDRDRQGKPRYNFPEADMPQLQTQRGVVFLEGASNQAPPGSLVGPAVAAPSTPDDQEADQDGPEQPQGAPPKARTPKGVVADLVKSYAASSGSASTEQRVHDQLAEDFPDSALSWLPQAKWTGPVAVSADEVDFSAEKSWAASHEPDKVQKFEKKLSRGKFKPVVLVKSPKNPQYIIADGHHRSLAARNLNAPILAYVGEVPKGNGPWLTMHDAQKTNDDTGKSPKKSLTPNAVADESLITAEVAAYRRWLKRPRRGRAFQFEHLTTDKALALGVVGLGDLGTLATFKAGDADPKGSGGQQPPDSQSWPGWDADMASAQSWAPKIVAALVAMKAVDAIIASLRKRLHFPEVSNPPTAAEVQAVEHWIEKTGVTPASVQEALTSTLDGLWTDGYYVGATAAQGVLSDAWDDAKDTLDHWQAGDPEATRLLLGNAGDGSGLAELLREDGVWIKGISETTVSELGKILARDVGEGLGYNEIARDLSEYIEDSDRALTIAITETCRAVSKATRDRYRTAGVRQVAWSTSLDDRVCPVCGANEAESPVPLGTPFDSGDFEPPAHPRCRCALIAIV